MCNEYARQIALAKLREEMAKARQSDFEWQGCPMISTPNPA